MKRQYRRFVFRKHYSPRFFIGIGPVGICVWRDWWVEFTWHGWGHKYLTDCQPEREGE